MPNFITLTDGRKLAYEQFGDSDGQPLLFFHGNPGSRLMRHHDDTIVENLGVRLITVDRPGYGQSDFQKGRTLLHWADDVAHLADALNLDRFYIMGVSAGGPYTAVAAHKLGDRVLAAAIVSGAAPIDRPNALDGMNDTFQSAFKAAQLPEWLLRPLIGIQRRNTLKDIDKSLDDSYAYISANDRKLLDTPAIREITRIYRREAYRQGAKGLAREAKILVSPWGFDLTQVNVPVHLWYWEDDSLVPPQMGRYLESKIPNTTPHFLDAGGHYSIYDHWHDIIDSLLKTNEDN